MYFGKFTTRCLLHTTAAATLAILSLASSTVHAAGWALDKAQSTLSVNVTDHRATGDKTSTLRATAIQGTIDAQGNIEMPLSLDQLDLIAKLPPLLTNKATQQSNITLKGHIDPRVLHGLSVGRAQSTPVSFWSDQQPAHRATYPLRLTLLQDQRIQVDTPTPIILDATPLLQKDNASIILSLLGYEKIDPKVKAEFYGILTSQ